MVLQAFIKLVDKLLLIPLSWFGLSTISCFEGLRLLNFKP